MLVAALASLALLAAGAGAWWLLARPDQQARDGAAPPRPPLVRTSEVQAADKVAITQTAFVRPVFEVDVTPEVSARIAALGEDFRVGGRVERGDVLVRLERDRLEAALAEAEARVEQARAAVTEARVTRQRQEELEAEDFASEARLQDAILGVARAEADLAAARAAETTARRRLDDTTIRAPFDALVTARTTAPGQAVSPGAPLGRLVATGAAQMRMGLTARDVALLGGAEAALGTAVAVLPTGAPGAGPLAEGVVTDTDPQVAEGSRTTGLIVRVEDAFAMRDPRPLRVGELVELRLAATLAGSGALSVPVEALKAGATLWRVSRRSDGAATLARVPATVIYRTRGRAVVAAEGLSPGDRVMLSDRAGALDGLRVRLARETEGAGGGSATGRTEGSGAADPSATSFGDAGSAASAGVGSGGAGSGG
ncbi:efflux RND transporter periplasmic adaptor subunit [Rhodovulum sp. 12E13]|uniref:efflux RND transporter periplasmic adaptor subunit n=1 Tax=Rhodovulum sp. 12E13 TaxID=2203891 RepID=UPI001314A8AE|nr:efflux RND transporter periplasmic adaptor subunit [Rhodovulum sp. 12E13]